MERTDMLTAANARREGKKHATEDAENGRCLSIQRKLNAPLDDYSIGYREGIVEFIKYVWENWN